MTPPEFLDAVRQRWSIAQFDVDLAASENNTGARRIITPEQDSLSVDWRLLTGDLWLNPPFGHIAPWAKKCATERVHGSRLFFLVPASVGSNWFIESVFERARVYLLRDRICFDGVNVFPKDCILAVYGETPGFEPWRWRAQASVSDRGAA